MVSVRQLGFRDLVGVQTANLMCLPENYNMRYYLYHEVMNPEAMYMAEDYKGKVRGYVLAKVDPIQPTKEEEEERKRRKMEREERKKKARARGQTLEEEEAEPPLGQHGHITSLAVRRTHRKCGIATRVMSSSQEIMKNVYDCSYVSLHVRRTNLAAFHLYNHTLQFARCGVEAGYYADGEDAFDMRRPLKRGTVKAMEGEPDADLVFADNDERGRAAG